MAGSDTLIVVPVDRFRAVAAAFAAPRPEESWVRATLGQLGVDSDLFWEPDYAEELVGSAEDCRQILNEAFTAALGDGVCIDTSIDLLLSTIARFCLEIEPLRELFDALNFDVQLPRSVWPVEYGLLGVWAGHTFAGPLEAVHRFATQNGVRDYFADRSNHAGDRLRGLPAQYRGAEREWLSEDFWATWEALLAPLSEAASDGSHVAFVAWD